MARALLHNTATVATACVGAEHVVVLCRDPEVRAIARKLGITVLHDAQHELNDALETALHQMRSQWPSDICVVMVADLPRVDTTQLRCVLNVIASSRDAPRHVADLAETGTTMVSIPPFAQVPMVFGRNSAARFREAGCVPIPDAPLGLRADLDTIEDLIAFGTDELMATAMVPHRD